MFRSVLSSVCVVGYAVLTAATAVAQGSLRQAPDGASRAEHLSMIIQAYTPCASTNPTGSIMTEILVFDGTDAEVFEALTRVSASDTVCDPVRLAAASLQLEYFPASGAPRPTEIDAGPSPETPVETAAVVDTAAITDAQSVASEDDQETLVATIEQAAPEETTEQASAPAAPDRAPDAEIVEAQIDATPAIEVAPIGFELGPPPSRKNF